MSLAKKRRWMWGSIVAAIGVVIGVLALKGPETHAGPTTPFVDEVVLKDALTRVKLTPEHLAASQVATGEVSGVVADVETHLAVTLLDLPSADQEYGLAKADCDRLRRKVRSGLATNEEITACQAAIQRLDTAESDLDVVLDAILEAGIADLSAAQKAALRTLRSNRSTWNMPLEFMTVDRTEPEWVRLREALANERICAESGEDPDADEQAHLASCRAEQDVAAAKVHMDTHLSAIQSAWDSAVEE